MHTYSINVMHKIKMPLNAAFLEKENKKYNSKFIKQEKSETTWWGLPRSTFLHFENIGIFYFENIMILIVIDNKIDIAITLRQLNLRKKK